MIPAEGEATQPVEAESRSSLDTGWELWLTDPGGDQRKFPICSETTRIGPGQEIEVDLTGGEIALLWGKGSLTLLQDRSSQPTALLDGAPAHGQLLPNDCLIEVGETRLHFVNARQDSIGSLQCYTDPFYGRIWHIPRGGATLGRRGKRNNGIELNHPTISRCHLLFHGSAQELEVEAESPNLTEVNGEPLAAGQRRTLQDNDLLQLGGLLFRYRESAQESCRNHPKLNMRCLGDLLVEWEGRAVPLDAWPSRKCLHLLARLALDWGKPIGLEGLVEEFWPDHDGQRGKKNLNWTMSSIRKCLGIGPGSDLFLRTTNTLQLNPDVLGEHDAYRLQQAMQAKFDRTAAAVALGLYRGNYLEGCYDEWAVRTREQLHLGALQLCRLLAEASQDGEERLALARRGLELDGSCQEFALLAMRALISLARGEEALKLFEQVRKNLLKDLDVEPSIDLLRERQRALALG